METPRLSGWLRVLRGSCSGGFPWGVRGTVAMASPSMSSRKVSTQNR